MFARTMETVYASAATSHGNRFANFDVHSANCGSSRRTIRSVTRGPAQNRAGAATVGRVLAAMARFRWARLPHQRRLHGSRQLGNGSAGGGIVQVPSALGGRALELHG